MRFLKTTIVILIFMFLLVGCSIVEKNINSQFGDYNISEELTISKDNNENSNTDNNDKIESFFDLINYENYIEGTLKSKVYDSDKEKYSITVSSDNGEEYTFSYYSADHSNYEPLSFECGRIDLTHSMVTKLEKGEKIKVYYEGEFIDNTEDLIVKAVTNSQTDPILNDWIMQVSDNFNSIEKHSVITGDDALKLVCNVLNFNEINKYIVLENQSASYYYSENKVVTLAGLGIEPLSGYESCSLYYIIKEYKYNEGDLNNYNKWIYEGIYYVSLMDGEVIAI